MVRNVVTAIAALAALTACASADAQQNAEGRDCFSTRSVRGYEIIDNNTILVRINDEQRYLLGVFFPTRSLDTPFSIRLEAPGNFVCTGNGAGVEIQGGRDDRTFLVTSVMRAPNQADSDTSS